MVDRKEPLNAVVIGGGFFGTTIAIYLAARRRFRRVLLVEQGPALLQRASYNNQARVHNGYHYPRSLTTAYRSRINLPQFLRDWPDSVKSDFTALYAIPRRNSKVTARQFERFCREIGAKFKVASSGLSALFQPHLIENVYQVEEYAFDASSIAKRACEELAVYGVETHLQTRATAIFKKSDGLLTVRLTGSDGLGEEVSSRYVINCTYSGVNQLGGAFPGVQTGLRHEIAEIALVRVPPALQELAITVMDGPFFSIMPFPPRGLHTLSHVRYTPHLSWIDERGVDPYARLRDCDHIPRVDRMIRDAGRYLSLASKLEYVESLFEIKTVLLKNETDDGRPILFEKSQNLEGCYTVLGGKLDNIYDVLEKFDAEDLSDRPSDSED